MHLLMKRWRQREADPAVAGAISATLGLNPLLGRLLASRGVADAGEAKEFLAPSLAALPDPFLMKGMDLGAERLATAIAGGETVLIHGDYDVDGMTAVTLLVRFIFDAGGKAEWYIPSRMEEGYGLSAAGIDAAKRAGASVMITVDCGITAVSEALLCAEAGIDLIITDHHTPGQEIPAAFAVINPVQPGCCYPFKGVAGVGVAFNLAMATRARLRGRSFFSGKTEPNLRRYLDLVALGTIADVVPLLGVNRVLVKFGLEELGGGSRIGIRALKKVAGVEGEVSCGSVGFRMAPRLNACGRLEEAAAGVQLLLTEDEAEAARIAEYLDGCNAERQAVERLILDEALKQAGELVAAGRKSIVLASDGWHPGVIGIVASRLVEAFHRPVILIALSEGVGKGSGRSIRSFHLHDALCRCSSHLQRFGGHRHAAGLTVGAGSLEAFIEAFEAAATEMLTPEDLVPELSIDAEIEAGELTLQLARDIELLRPFGMGNPEPVFALPEATVSGEKILRDQHLKLRVAAGTGTFDAIGFNMADRGGLDRVKLAFTPQVNIWNGRTSLQLQLRDIAAREASGR